MNRRRFVYPAARALQLAGLVAVVCLLSAFTLQPISQEFSPSGAESSRVFQVHNPGSQPVAMRLEMLERLVDEHGTETNPSARGSFAVFPTQFVLEPGQRRNIRVRYTGSENLERERSYRLLAEQLPVDLTETELDRPQGTEGTTGRPGQGSIQIMFRYLASIFVVPPNAAGPNPVVSLLERVSADESGLLLRFENSGGRHVILRDLELELRLDNGSPHRVAADALAGIRGENLLAGSSRIHFLPLTAELVDRVRDVGLSY